MKNKTISVLVVIALLISIGGAYHFYTKFKSEKKESSIYKEEIAKRKAEISNLRNFFANKESMYQKKVDRLKEARDSLRKAIKKQVYDLASHEKYYKELSNEKQIKHLEENLDTILYVDSKNTILLPMNRASWINVTYAERETLEMISRSQFELIEQQDSIIRNDSLYIAEQSNHIDILYSKIDSTIDMAEEINLNLKTEEEKNKLLKNVLIGLSVVAIIEGLIIIF